MGARRESDDPFRKVTPNMEGEIDLVRRQSGVLVQREDSISSDEIERPAIMRYAVTRKINLCTVGLNQTTEKKHDSKITSKDTAAI